MFFFRITFKTFRIIVISGNVYSDVCSIMFCLLNVVYQEDTVVPKNGNIRTPVEMTMSSE